MTIVASVPAGAAPALVISDKGLDQKVMLSTGALEPGPSVLARAGTDDPLSATGSLPGVTVRLDDASLVWFAGSDGGTVPPQPDEAYLQVLATATPLGSSFLPASDFTLDLPGGRGRPGAGAARCRPGGDRRRLPRAGLVQRRDGGGVFGRAVVQRARAFPVEPVGWGPCPSPAAHPRTCRVLLLENVHPDATAALSKRATRSRP